MRKLEDDGEKEIQAMSGMLDAINIVDDDWPTRQRVREWFNKREQTMYEQRERETEYDKLYAEKVVLEKELARMEELEAHKIAHPYSQRGPGGEPMIPRTTEPT